MDRNLFIFGYFFMLKFVASQKDVLTESSTEQCNPQSPSTVVIEQINTESTVTLETNTESTVALETNSQSTGALEINTQSPSTVVSIEQRNTQPKSTVVSTEQSNTQSPSTVVSQKQCNPQSPSTVVSTEQSTTQSPSTVVSTEQSTTQSPSSVISIEQSTTQSTSTVILTDINECESENGNCSQGCVNNHGSYECTCNEGYTLDIGQHTCEDINECESENGNCSQGCVNNHGSYKCTCNEGYTLDIGQRTCEDIDECDHGNGNCKWICVNTSPGYHCNCNAGYGLLDDGINCKVLFDFQSYGPNYGPTDGGTIVTLYGDLSFLSKVQNITLLKLDVNGNAFVTENSELKCEVLHWDKLSIAFRTPFVNESFSGTNYSINVVYTTTQKETIEGNTGKLFTYKPNPIITGIFPRTLFVSGGIRLTAMGMFFDSIAQPVLIMTVEKRFYDATKNTFTVKQKHMFKSENTTVYNNTIIIGITPNISLSAIERKKRDTHNTSQVINNRNLEIFVGFELDGTKSYENLTQALGEDGAVTLIHTPEVKPKKDVIRYNPKTDTHVDIEGAGFLDGATVSDFSVDIGNESGIILDVTDNKVLFKPPEKEPIAIPGPRYIDGKPAVALFVGKRKYHIGHIDYTTEELLILYITVSVGLIVILIAVIVLVICISQHRKKQRDSAERMSDIMTGSYLHPAHDYLRPQPNLRLYQNHSRRPNSKLIRTNFVQSQPQNSGLYRNFLRKPTSKLIRPNFMPRSPTGIDNFPHYDNNFRKLVSK